MHGLPSIDPGRTIDWGKTSADYAVYRGGYPADFYERLRALGVEGPVTSPTFTIGHRYPGTPDVSHLDLYRFRGLSPAEWGDLEPYFDEAVVFVEWPEAGSGRLPRERAHVLLEHVAPDRRRVRVDAGEDSLLQALTGAGPGLRHRD